MSRIYACILKQIVMFCVVLFEYDLSIPDYSVVIGLLVNGEMDLDGCDSGKNGHTVQEFAGGTK